MTDSSRRLPERYVWEDALNELVEEIILLLPITRERGWSSASGIRGGTKIIRDARGFCPLCALANEIDPIWFEHLNAKGALEFILGRAQFCANPTEFAAATEIVMAADGGNQNVRRRLNIALGLRSDA